MSTTETITKTKSRMLDTTHDYSIESNYTHHPSELVNGGKAGKAGYTAQDLKDAIPAYCFKPTYAQSFWYLFRDFAVTAGFMAAAYNFIPMLPNVLLRTAAWLTYGYYTGLQMTGIWVIGHEAGHGSFATNDYVNDTVGWVLHSLLMTPYFSWQSTHRRHHIYANNMSKDHNYVPVQKEKYASLMGVHPDTVEELAEDLPIVTLARIVFQQVIGFPWYLFANITASQGSLAAGKTKNPPSKWPGGNSHFMPNSTLFRPQEAHLILASDIGIGMAMYACYYAAQHIGWPMVALLYIQPYMWVNHWIVAITYLHHTHPSLPKYEPEAWTFLRGALATVDRNLGFAGKHFLHNISDYHVIHHLYSRIPHYYAEEATKAIQPLLGEDYHEDRTTNFWYSIYESFTQCQYVVPDFPEKEPADRKLFYKGGPSPPIEVSIGRGGINLSSSGAFKAE